MVGHMQTLSLLLSSLSIILANKNQYQKLTRFVGGVLSEDQHECTHKYKDNQPGEEFDSKSDDFEARFTEIDTCKPSWLYKCDPHYVVKPRCTLRTTAHFIIAGISFVGLVILGTTVYFAVKYGYNR